MLSSLGHFVDTLYKHEKLHSSPKKSKPKPGTCLEDKGLDQSEFRFVQVVSHWSRLLSSMQVPGLGFDVCVELCNFSCLFIQCVHKMTQASAEEL